jgi:hypothetical protein
MEFQLSVDGIHNQLEYFPLFLIPTGILFTARVDEVGYY